MSCFINLNWFSWKIFGLHHKGLWIIFEDKGSNWKKYLIAAAVMLILNTGGRRQKHLGWCFENLLLSTLWRSSQMIVMIHYILRCLWTLEQTLKLVVNCSNVWLDVVNLPLQQAIPLLYFFRLPFWIKIFYNDAFLSACKCEEYLVCLNLLKSLLSSPLSCA